MSATLSLFFPGTYQESRERFLSYLPRFQEIWPAASHEVQALAGGEGLATDLIRADSRGERSRILLITTGLHGVEGYMGAAVLDLFASEFLPRIDPTTVGVVLVHALNPWGMHHKRRVNPANVDLNRNFLWEEADFERIENPGYQLLDTMLNPRRRLDSIPLESLRMVATALIRLSQHGLGTLREAVLQGQRSNSQGIYFSGHSFQPETLFIKGLLEGLLAGYQGVTQIDVHTGYGPRYQMSLVNSPSESSPPGELQDMFDYPRVLRADPEDFYTMQGDMIDWAYRLAARSYPDMSYYGTAFEFGTYGESALQEIRSLLTMILENMGFQYGVGSKRIESAIAKRFFEFFLPAEPAWREKAVADARQAMEGILTARQII